MDRKQACERALQFDNNDKSVLCKCGIILRYVKEIEKARELLEKALSIRRSSRVFHHLGLTYQTLATIEYRHHHEPLEQSSDPGAASSDKNLSRQFGYMSIERPGFKSSIPYHDCDARAMPARSTNDGPRYSLKTDVRAMQRVNKSPPKGVTTYSRDDRFVTEALYNLEQAVEFSEGENTRAMYDLALLKKRLGEPEEAIETLQKMLKNESSLFDADYVKGFEQLGLIKRDVADSETDETRKKLLIEDSKKMLLKALKAASVVFSNCPGINEHLGEVWHSFTALLQAAEKSCDDDTHTMQEKVVLFQLIRDHKQSVDLLRKIQEMDPQKAEDPEYLRLCIESYKATGDYEELSVFLDLLKRTSQNRKTVMEKHFFVEAYMQAARQTLLHGDVASAKLHFMSAFLEAMAVVDPKETSPLTPSPKDCITSKSTNTDRDAVPVVTTSGGEISVTPADGASADAKPAVDTAAGAKPAVHPAAGTEHWDVILLHEEESIQKADSLIHVMQTFYGIRVTSRYRALQPSDQELKLSKIMEKCHVVAVLAETDDHKD